MYLIMSCVLFSWFFVLRTCKQQRQYEQRFFVFFFKEKKIEKRWQGCDGSAHLHLHGEGVILYIPLGKHFVNVWVHLCATQSKVGLHFTLW